jgi:hypothetical protein
MVRPRCDVDVGREGIFLLARPTICEKNSSVLSVCSVTFEGSCLCSDLRFRAQGLQAWWGEGELVIDGVSGFRL